MQEFDRVACRDRVAQTGIYNIVDDEPAPIGVWRPKARNALGARPLRQVPVWLGRLTAGESAGLPVDAYRRPLNAKANSKLVGWRLQYDNWRDGFRHGLVEARQAPADRLGWRCDRCRPTIASGIAKATESSLTCSGTAERSATSSGWRSWTSVREFASFSIPRRAEKAIEAFHHPFSAARGELNGKAWAA
jgi:hypothetical protein